jgi:glutaredoxin
MPDIKKVKPNGEYKSGLFSPSNPEKYMGDIHNIIYRSSWEYRFCVYCDTNESILKWSSEPISIDYYNPLDKKNHKYNVDFYIKVLKEDGESQEWIIEIKPEKQKKKPVYEGSMTLTKLKSYNRNMQIWITNQAKFKAAKEWAEKRNFKFGVIDENFLFKSK